MEQDEDVSKDSEVGEMNVIQAMSLRIQAPLVTVAA